jgi:hypothetical protein
MDMALYFQSITAHAVYSNYNRSEIFNKNKKLRIATEAVNRGQKFADAMKSFGHMYDFNCNKDFMRENEESVEEETFGLEGPRSVDDGYEEEEEEEQENVEEEGQLSDDEETDRFVHLMGALRCQIRLEDDHIDIQDVVQERTKVSKVTKKDILSWLRKEYRESRGFELGTFDTALLNVVMKEQAAKWRGLALGYISDIISLVHSFILGVLDYITPNSRVREGIRTNILEDMTKMYRNAISQTEFLISVELDGTPATYDPYFNETREKM